MRVVSEQLGTAQGRNRPKLRGELAFCLVGGSFRGFAIPLSAALLFRSGFELTACCIDVSAARRAYRCADAGLEYDV